MTRFFYPAVVTLLLLGTNQLRAQFCTTDARYTATPVFADDEIDVDRRLQYGMAENAGGLAQNLFLDLYFPDNDLDTATARPLILLVHGGGFRDGARQNLEFECREFARRGFVAATIDYRVGFDRRNPITYLNAVFRAEQDALAALRYLGSVADAYRIDPTWAFLGGVSAGSITSLNTVYAGDDDWEATLPGITQRLGSLEGSGNQLPISLQVRGVFNNWGSTLPTAITTPELLPMIAFHGALDVTVPIDTSDLGLIGSRPIHELLLGAGVCSDLTIDLGGRHGVYKDSLGTLARVAKTSCFFKRVFCDECQSVTATALIPAACEDIISKRIDVLEDRLTIYPNPTSGRLNIDGLLPGTLLEVMDGTGRLLFRGSAKTAQPLLNQPAGVYYLRFTRDGKNRVTRVIRRD